MIPKPLAACPNFQPPRNRFVTFVWFCFVTLVLHSFGKPLVAPSLASDVHVSEGNCPMSVEATPSFTSTILPFCSAKDLPESDPGTLFSKSFIVLALNCSSLETENSVEQWLHFWDDQAVAQSGCAVPTVSNENAIKAHRITQESHHSKAELYSRTHM